MAKEKKTETAEEKKKKADAQKNLDEESDDELDVEDELEHSQDEEGNDEKDEDDEELDYKALADAETKRADDAVAAAADMAFKLRNKKRKNKNAQDDDEDDSDEDDENAPVTRGQLKTFETQIVNRTRKETQQITALQIARTLANGNEDMAHAIVTFYNTRVIPTGNLQEDVYSAFGILNSKKLVSKNGELKRALKNRSGENNDSAGTHRDGAEATTPKLAKDLTLSLRRAGYVFDVKSKTFKKKLPNGKFHVKDAKGVTIGFSS